MSYGVADIKRRLRLGEHSRCRVKRIEFCGDRPINPKRNTWADGIVAFANAGGGILLGEDLRLTDADGNELSIRIVVIGGQVGAGGASPVCRMGKEEMTVGELIRIPEGRPDGLCVVADNCGKGYDDLLLGRVSPVRIFPKTEERRLESRHGDPPHLTGRLPGGVEIAEVPAFRRTFN